LKLRVNKAYIDFIRRDMCENNWDPERFSARYWPGSCNTSCTTKDIMARSELRRLGVTSAMHTMMLSIVAQFWMQSGVY
jgi:hypothetical protein